MEITGRSRLVAACEHRPELGTGIRTWVRTTLTAEWASFNDIKKTHPSAEEHVGLVAFKVWSPAPNISRGQGRYLLLVRVHFAQNLVHVDSVELERDARRRWDARKK
ncbi:MAG: type II toxin-antitoxin system HigB family toxin [Planctomycetes bacterium]|nr:type II toxin-antitoxin system HigB family toxin [Planctomycetota bacterium]